MSTAEIRAPSDQPPGVQGRRRKSPLAAATRPPSRCFRPEQGPARCRLLRLSALPGLDRRCSNQRLSHSHQRPREWICLTGVRGRKPGRSGRIRALQDPRFRLSDLGRTFSRPAHQLDAALAIPHAKSLDSEKPRRRFVCALNGMSPIASRNSVPPWACSITHFVVRGSSEQTFDMPEQFAFKDHLHGGGGIAEHESVG